MVTLKDVGELAGVTATTASAALRGKDYVKPETTQRVRDAARKLGYKINLSGRSLRSGRSDTITFLTSGLEGDYFSHLAMCVAEEVHKRDSHMLIELSRYLTDDNDLSYTFSDGIIAINAPPNNPNIIPGSRDIRMRAAKETILAAGLPFDERRDFIKSSWSIDGGIEAGRGLAKKGKCKYDGLYCLNDGIALGILRGLADDGVSVPGDVRVIGFDGLSQSMYSVPTLTTVATDFKGMADTALRIHCGVESLAVLSFNWVIGLAPAADIRYAESSDDRI